MISLSVIFRVLLLLYVLVIHRNLHTLIYFESLVCFEYANYSQQTFMKAAAHGIVKATIHNLSKHCKVFRLG